MIIKSLSLTGTAAQASLTNDTSKAKWVQLLADSANSGNVLVGGNDTSATVGFPLAAGSSQFLPSISDLFEFYQLSSLYFYAGNGDKLHVLYGVEGQNT